MLSVPAGARLAYSAEQRRGNDAKVIGLQCRLCPFAAKGFCRGSTSPQKIWNRGPQSVHSSECEPWAETTYLHRHEWLRTRINKHSKRQAGERQLDLTMQDKHEQNGTGSTLPAAEFVGVPRANQRRIRRRMIKHRLRLL